MKRLLFILMVSLMAGAAMAQPKVRRNQTKQTQSQSSSSSQGGMTMRAQLMYPKAIDMPEEVVWRRDIYREIDLAKSENAGLYYPVEPTGKEMNLFTYIFKLALWNYIPVYEYRLDGNEVFDDSSRVDMKTILDNYHIYYENKNGRLRVENSDIPSSEVKVYYLKESAYYDQANASFHRKVVCLCPVMMREDDFGGEASKYPLFWVKYSDLEPFLSRQTVMTSDFNNAATMGMDDYFTMSKYKGKIYKTTNMLGKTLSQYCNNDTTLAKEQKRIEGELMTFEKNIFGDQARKDSLDSIARQDPKALRAAAKAAAKSSKRNRRSSSVRTKSTSTSSSSGSAPARVTVRRQRH